MREYSVTRTTMEWNRIMRQIRGDPPMRRGIDDLSQLADDIEKMLEFDNAVIPPRHMPAGIERK